MSSRTRVIGKTILAFLSSEPIEIEVESALQQLTKKPNFEKFNNKCRIPCGINESWFDFKPYALLSRLSSQINNLTCFLFKPVLVYNFFDNLDFVEKTYQKYISS